VAELVRAAEAIDRAAAAESELAHAAERAAGDPGQPQPDAAAVKAEQAKVADVVEKIAEGIRNAAPQAAAAVERATPPIVDNEPAEAAEALVQAAAAIRREAVETARNLARGQESQLEAAMRAQEAMADGKQPPSAEEAADQADRLAEFTRATKLADRLAEEVAAQQQSRDAIAEQTAALEKDRASESAKALRKAQEAFAAAQEAAGKTAAALAGQGELANQPLREGLERASQLDAVAAAAKPEPPATDAASSSTGEPASPLGTGFVPESPEATAELIAGSEAEAAAERLLGPAPRAAKGESLAQQSGRNAEPGSTNQPSTSAKPDSPANAASGKKSEKPSQDSASQSSTKPDRSQGARQGEATADGPLEEAERVDKDAAVAGTRTGDADQAGKSFEQESWFAKLPPGMRQAIRAKSQRRAPRGYEEKLDRYFRNID
jgi:hypothetical protein